MSARPAVLLALGLLCGAAAAASAPGDEVRVSLARLGWCDGLLTPAGGGLFTLRVGLDTLRLDLLVDNRLPVSFLDLVRMKKLGFEPKPTTSDIAVGGRREPVYRLDLPNVLLGSLNSGPLSINVARIDFFVDAAGVDEAVRVDGIMGHDLLDRFSAITDLKERRLFLRRPPQIDTAAVRRDTAAAAADSLLAPGSETRKGKSMIDKIEDRINQTNKPKGGR